MTQSGTRKKTAGTGKKKASRSKTASTSSTTQMPLLVSKSAKVRFASSSPVKPQKTSSQSSSPGEEKPGASSRPGQPPAKSAEPTWDDEGWETQGWSKPRKITAQEHEELKKVFDENENPRIRVLGRPKKAFDEKANPSGIRLSLKQRRAFDEEAKRNGFRSWQTWLKDLGDRAAGLKEAN